MKITKYVHSCLLVEHNGKTILLDPGLYTYQEKALDLSLLSILDYIGITHEHFDHMHIPLLRDLLAKFPTAQIVTNAAIVTLLAKENIQATTQQNEYIALQPVPHEKLMDVPPPQNVQIDLFRKLTHPGDSLQFTTTCEILALPIQAPWGSMVQAVEKAREIKPKAIIPIHDWHWKDEVRIGMYDRLEVYFKPLGIEFKKAETGETIIF